MTPLRLGGVRAEAAREARFPSTAGCAETDSRPQGPPLPQSNLLLRHPRAQPLRLQKAVTQHRTPRQDCRRVAAPAIGPGRRGLAERCRSLSPNSFPASARPPNGPCQRKCCKLHTLYLQHGNIFIPDALAHACNGMKTHFMAQCGKLRLNRAHIMATFWIQKCCREHRLFRPTRARFAYFMMILMPGVPTLAIQRVL